MITNDDLILDNMNLAYDIAWKYYNKFGHRFELDDLQQIALLGLTKAAKTYNYELGYTFGTYCYQVIKNEFLMHLKSNYKHLDVISISQPLFDEVTLEDTLAIDVDIEENLVDDEYIQKLYAEINKLSDRYKTIIIYRLKGLTMVQIGQKLNISKQQISKDYNKALNILRNKFKDWREI